MKTLTFLFMFSSAIAAAQERRQDVTGTFWTTSCDVVSQDQGGREIRTEKIKMARPYASPSAGGAATQILEYKKADGTAKLLKVQSAQINAGSGIARVQLDEVTDLSGEEQTGVTYFLLIGNPKDQIGHRPSRLLKSTLEVEARIECLYVLAN